MENNIRHFIDDFHMPYAMALLDNKGNFITVNDFFRQVIGKDRQAIIGSHYLELPINISELDDFKLAMTEKKPWTNNITLQKSELQLNITIIPYQLANQVYYFMIGHDVTEHIKTEKKLIDILANDLHKTVENIQNGVFKLCKLRNDEIVFTLSEGKLMKALQMETMVLKNKNVFEVFPADLTEVLEENFARAFEDKEVSFEIRIDEQYFLVYLSPIKEDDEITEVVGSIIDITKRKSAEKQIHYIANHDSLTGLLNRRALEKKLDNLLDNIKGTDHDFHVLFIDLDRFKDINDTFGHSQGDELLIQVAEQMESLIRADRGDDYIARQGGDEFIIILKDVSTKQAEMIAKRITEAIAETSIIGNMQLYVTPSIGISVFPKDGLTATELLKKSDMAMYHMKRQGGNGYLFYSDELNQSDIRKLQLDNDLRYAIEKDELVLYYQPQVDLRKNKITGFEALIRWQHTSIGLISPDEFIPIAEASGLIIPIGEWVIREACLQLKQWHDRGHADLTMAVNISFRQFNKRNLPSVIQGILQETGLPAHALELEITESMMMDLKYAPQMIKSLKALGLSISIDDFGTGYSSLSYLSSYPINALKIDQSFIRNLTEQNKSIIKTIIDLSKNLAIDVIAEGVEREEHKDYLISKGCKYGQGYLFSRPLPASEVHTLL